MAGRKPKLNATRTSVLLANDVLEYLRTTKNVSAEIERIVRDEMNDYQKVTARLSEIGFSTAEIEIILGWWSWREHAEWLLTASAKEIREASKPAFEN